MTMSCRSSSFARFVAVALVAGLLAAACGSDTEGQSPSRPDDDAVLKIGEVLTQAAAYRPEFDPIKPASAGAVQYLFYVYDSLLRENRDGSYSPALAERAEIVDGSTITVTLRPDLKFQDGTPMDAEAVKFTILRNKKANNVAAMRQSQLQAVKSIAITSPTELTIHLSKPVAGAFFHLLAHNETVPVSPAAVDAGKDLSVEPVGAGPFKLVSQSDEMIRLEKWPEYHDADKVRFAAIEIVNVASAEARTNAFRTGAIDFDPQVTLTDLKQLSGAPIQTEAGIAATPAFDWLELHCNNNPDLLGDVRVRQALIYATDREAILELVYGGEGEVQTQFVASDSPLYDPELADLYTHDVEKARSLLAKAGMSDLKLTTVGSSRGGAGPRIAEILQQQWAEAGITLEIVPTNNPVNDFFVTGKIATQVVPGDAKWWSDRFTRWFSPESLGGTCVSDDPTFTQDLDALQALDPESDEASKMYRKLTRTLLEDARFVPILVAPTTAAWSDRLGEITLRPSQVGKLTPDFFGTYVTAG